MKRQNSQRDIAIAAQVSQPAVSAVLRGEYSKVRVSAKIRSRILKVAQDLNYRPHSSARAMLEGRYRAIGIMIAFNAESYYIPSQIEQSICETATEYDYHVTLVRLPAGKLDDEVAIPKFLRESHLDAVVVVHAGWLPAKLVSLMKKSGVPLVYFNDKRPRNAVYVDDVQVGRKATEHLLSVGCRRIVFLADAVDLHAHYSSSDRIRGYREVMLAAGLEPEIKQIAADGWRAVTREWLSRNPGIDGVFCSHDPLALRVQQAALEIGRRIPQELAVVGVNDELYADMSPIPLTTIHVPWREMASAAAHMAVRLGKEPGEQVKSMIFDVSVTVRETTQRHAAPAVGKPVRRPGRAPSLARSRAA